jgi:hypothetical protein
VGEKKFNDSDKRGKRKKSLEKNKKYVREERGVVSENKKGLNIYIYR